MVRGATILDLGAGCGLTALTAAAAGAQTVFCTDHEATVLANAAANVEGNRRTIGPEADVRVRRLHWDGWAALPHVAGASSTPTTIDDGTDGGCAGDFDWRDADAPALARTSLLLAADCCYDDDATDALLRCVSGLLDRAADGARALFALERRVCFCVEGLRARAPAAEHFEAAVRARVATGEWAAEALNLADVPQRFEGYDRGSATTLDLWCVTRGAAE